MNITFSKRSPNGYFRVYADGEEVGEIYPTITSTLYRCPCCEQTASKNKRTSGYALSVPGMLWNNKGVAIRRGEPGYGGSNFWTRRLRDVKAKAIEVLS